MILQVYCTSLRGGLRSSGGYHQLTLADYCTGTHFLLGPIHSFSAPTTSWFRSHHLPCIGPKTGRSATVVQPPLAPVLYLPCLLVVAGIPIASISLVRAAEFLVCLTPKPTSKLLTVGVFVPTSSTYLPPCGSHRLSLFLNHHRPRLGECRSALGTYQHIPYRFSWPLDIFFFPFLFAPTGRLAIRRSFL